MKKRSIFGQLLLPMIAVVCALVAALISIIVLVFTQSYEAEIQQKNRDKSSLVSGEIKTFLDGAYSVTEELSVNPSILTMDTEIQTPILADCVKRNTYLELLYIQGTDGMQTGRSSGELADRSTRWWFLQMMEEEKPFVSKSYYSVNTGMPCASIFFPMYRNEKLLGVFAVDLKLDYLQSLIEEFSDMENGEYSFVIDGEGVVVAHPDSVQIEELYNYKTQTKTVSSKDEAGNPLTDSDGNILTEEQPFDISEEFKQVIADVMAGNSGSGKMENDEETYYVSYASIPLKGESDSWSIITLQKEANAMAAIDRIILVSVIVSAIGITAAILVIAFLAHRLTKPIVSITELIGNASDGDFTKKADERIKNELGVLSGSFNKMIEKIAGILTRITMFSGGVVQSAGRLQAIEEDVNRINHALREISDGTDRQNRDVGMVVESAGELEKMFGELQEKNGLLKQDVQNTIISEENGEQSVIGLKQQNTQIIRLMEDVYRKVVSLEEQSQRISGIVNTISDISSQTSMLALNASIEAAHAGDMGKGFAVVAESVGKLANDSSKSTGDIIKIIDDLCRNIKDTVEKIQSMKTGIDGQKEAVAKVEDTFNDFKRLAGKTKDSVENIDRLIVDMQECDSSMVRAVESIGEVSSNMARLSEEAANSMEEQLEGIRDVSKRVDDLSKASGEMEQEMTKFKYKK